MRALAVKMRLAMVPLYSFGYLKNLLEKLTRDRHAAGLKGDFIQAMAIDKDSKMIVLGVVQGAYHSMVRDLTKMHSLGLITNDFKFTNDKISITFLGNVVGRSFLTTETLFIILKLMEKNPERVFYLKGEHEFNDTWVNHTLKRELELGARFLSREKIPLFKQVSEFFNTLPLELYAVAQFKKTSQVLPIIVLSANLQDRENLLKKIDEKSKVAFLKHATTHKPAVMNLDTPLTVMPGSNDLEIVPVATVRDIRKRDGHIKMDGLRKLYQEGHTVAWTILSSPLATYRHGLKFFNDAFCVFSFGEAFAQWKITLYSRNIMSANQNFSVRQENLVSSEVQENELSLSLLLFREKGLFQGTFLSGIKALY